MCSIKQDLEARRLEEEGCRNKEQWRLGRERQPRLYNRDINYGRIYNRVKYILTFTEYMFSGH